MMISPELYYDEYLHGRSQKEILHVIRSLKREINRLKRELEDISIAPKTQIMPSPLTQLKISRYYLEKAKQVYEEAGGKYEPTKVEQRDKEFNEALTFIKKICA